MVYFFDKSGSDGRTAGGNSNSVFGTTSEFLSEQTLYADHVRRMIDISVACAALILTSPLLLVYSLVLKIVSPGPTFVKIERIGRQGLPFGLFKLRTMCLDAEARLSRLLADDPELQKEWRGGFKLRRDPRLVPFIGRFARRFSIDELPQMINVLRGEMTLVGPRPFPAYHLEAFEPEFRQRRASVMPGLTGLWQVERMGNSLSEQIALDMKYLDRRSLQYDVSIFLRTPKAVLLGHGAN